MNMKDKLISFEGVDIFYGRNIVLNNVNLNFCRGDKIGIIGQNGSGKTTLVKTIMNLHKSYRGSLTVDPRLRIGYAAQRTNLDMLIPLTVKEYVSLNFANGNSLTDDHFSKWCDKLELTGLFNKRFSDVSGGQKQRAVLLRAMLSNPDCLILDEPTDNLDICSQKTLLSLIDEFCAQTSMTLILISHTLDAIINHVNRMVILKDSQTSEILIDNAKNIGDSLSRIFETEITVKLINGKWVVL